MRSERSVGSGAGSGRGALRCARLLSAAADAAGASAPAVARSSSRIPPSAPITPVASAGRKIVEPFPAVTAGSATVTLGQWCAREKLADPPVIRAERVAANKPATADVRALLQVGANEAVRYRRVRLMCGRHVLSEADNWYVPSRLTPAMNTALDTTDTPFGAAVKALDFHRRTLDAAPAPGTVLRVRALLLTPDAVPFSLVVENYTPDLTGR